MMFTDVPKLHFKFIFFLGLSMQMPLVFAAALSPETQYKKVLLDKVENVVKKSTRDIDAVSHYDCYWNLNIGSGKCVLKMSTCLKMREDRGKYPLADYKAILKQLNQFVTDKQNIMTKKITESRENSPKLQASIDDAIKELGTGVQNMLEGFKMNLTPLQADYKALYGKPECPK